MSTQFASKNIERFEKKYGEQYLQFACHAALPVVVDSELVHLIRVNFFLDPPEQLPYTAEADLLLSNLCQAIDDDEDLYELDRDIRDELLKKLVIDYGITRIKEVAMLLWHYTVRCTAWQERASLAAAQQLTVLNFLDPQQANMWLSVAETSVGSIIQSDRRWFVAMRTELEQNDSSIEAGQRSIIGTISEADALAKLRNVLAELYDSQASSRRVVDDSGLISQRISFNSSAINNWHNVINEARRQNKIEAIVSVALLDYSNNKALRDSWDTYISAKDLEQRKTKDKLTKAPDMLHNILSELYTDEHSIRRVTSDAGLSQSLVSWNFDIPNNWRAILEEAQKQGKVSSIINTALQEYPNNRDLKNISETYLDGTGQIMVDAFPGTLDGREGHDSIQQVEQSNWNVPTNALIKLRSALATLYSDADSSLRMITVAGLETRGISLISSSLNNWYEILRVAVIQRKVDDIIQIALSEYSSNPELRDACEAYHLETEQVKQPDMSNSTDILAVLRDVLSDLYPAKADVQRVIDEAGLEANFVSLTSNVRNNWLAILEGAKTEHKILAIIGVALRDYGYNQKLSEIYQAYKDIMGESQQNIGVDELNTAIARLRDILTLLYSKELEARVILDDAGIVQDKIRFETNIRTFWHSIIKEALQQDRFSALAEVALHDYSTNKELVDAYQTFLDTSGQIHQMGLLKSYEFAQLRDELAIACPDPYTVREIMVKVGLPHYDIFFEIGSMFFWHWILKKAVRESKVDELIAVVRDTYPSNDKALQSAYEAYLRES